MVATQVRPEWAIQACDNYGHGLEWLHEVDKNGKKTGKLYVNSKEGLDSAGHHEQCMVLSAGLAALVYNLDPSTPHQHTESSLFNHLRKALENAIGRDLSYTWHLLADVRSLQLGIF